MPYPTLPGRKFEYDVGGGSVYVGVKTNGSPSEATVSYTHLTLPTNREV